jgi:uncharacterized protein YcbX
MVQRASVPPAPTGVRLTGIRVYPLKSAKGVDVQSSTLDERGLAFDRMWMVVDERGSFLSQRRAPRLATVVAALPVSHSAPLRLSAPSSGVEAIEVPVVAVADSPEAATLVRVWDDHVAAVDQGAAAAAWLEQVLGVPGARLVRMADGAKRQCSRKYAPRGSLTAFSDGFPLLLASEASLQELNRRLAERGAAPVPMERFR